MPALPRNSLIGCWPATGEVNIIHEKENHFVLGNVVRFVGILHAGFFRCLNVRNYSATESGEHRWIIGYFKMKIRKAVIAYRFELFQVSHLMEIIFFSSNGWLIVFEVI